MLSNLKNVKRAEWSGKPQQTYSHHQIINNMGLELIAKIIKNVNMSDSVINVSQKRDKR